MIYKGIVFLSIFIFCIVRAPINLSGLLPSSNLNKNITTAINKSKARINLSGQLSKSDLSQIVQIKVSPKKTARLSGLLSSNQLDSVIQFMNTKQQQAKGISGLISSKDLDKSIVWNIKRKKPRINLSGLLVQNYLDPDYQAAFKILNDTQLQQEYDNSLRNMETYFKEYYLSQPSTVLQKKVVIDLPKICCPVQGQNYTLCSIEQ